MNETHTHPEEYTESNGRQTTSGGADQTAPSASSTTTTITAAAAPMLFDPSMKKKKKKRDGKGTSTAAVASQQQQQQQTTEEASNRESDDATGGASATVPAATSAAAADVASGETAGHAPPVKHVTFRDQVESQPSPVSDQPDAAAPYEDPWQGTDRDYTYTELLHRLFEYLHGRHPTLVSGVASRRRFSLRPPQIAREGSKKTMFLNFGDICTSLDRQPEHLLAYMSAELGTTGNLQEGGRVALKGRYPPDGFERVLRRYVGEYVLCRSCKSPNTALMRDANTRLYFMRCKDCGSERSVAPIKQGFMAQTDKRSWRRAAGN